MDGEGTTDGFDDALAELPAQTSKALDTTREIGASLLQQINNNRILLDGVYESLDSCLARIFERLDADEVLQKYLGSSVNISSLVDDTIPVANRVASLKVMVASEKGLAQTDDEIFKKQVAEVSRGLKNLKNYALLYNSRGTAARNADTEANQLIPLVVLSLLKSPDNSKELITRIRRLKEAEDHNRQDSASALKNLLAQEPDKKSYRLKSAPEIFDPIYKDAEEVLKMTMPQMRARHSLYEHITNSENLDQLNRFDIDSFLSDSEAFLQLNEERKKIQNSEKVSILTVNLIERSKNLCEKLQKVKEQQEADEKTLSPEDLAKKVYRTDDMLREAKVLLIAMNTLIHSRSHDHLSRVQEFRQFALAASTRKDATVPPPLSNAQPVKVKPITIGEPRLPADSPLFKNINDRNADVIALKKTIGWWMRNFPSENELPTLVSRLLSTRYMANEGWYTNDAGVFDGVRNDAKIQRHLTSKEVKGSQSEEGARGQFEAVYSGRGNNADEFNQVLKRVEMGKLKSFWNWDNAWLTTNTWGKTVRPLYIGTLAGAGLGVLTLPAAMIVFGVPLGAASGIALLATTTCAQLGAGISVVSAGINAVTGGKDSKGGKFLTWAAKGLVVIGIGTSLYKDGMNSGVVKFGEQVVNVTQNAIVATQEAAKSPEQKALEVLQGQREPEKPGVISNAYDWVKERLGYNKPAPTPAPAPRADGKTGLNGIDNFNNDSAPIPKTAPAKKTGLDGIDNFQSSVTNPEKSGQSFVQKLFKPAKSKAEFIAQQSAKNDAPRDIIKDIIEKVGKKPYAESVTAQQESTSTKQIG